MSDEEALQEIRTLLGLYPLMQAGDVVDRVLTLWGDLDAEKFTTMCLLAERRSLIDSLREAHITHVHGTPLDEIVEKGFRL